MDAQGFGTIIMSGPYKVLKNRYYLSLCLDVKSNKISQDTLHQ